MKGMKTLFYDHKHTQKNIEINVLNENIKKVFAIYIYIYVCVCVCVCACARVRVCIKTWLSMLSDSTNLH